MTTKNNIFLDIAASSGNNKASSSALDQKFLSSYFRIPAMTHSEESHLFSSPTKVMQTFIETRLSSKVENNNEDAATSSSHIVDENKRNAQLISLLTAAALVLEKHATEANILREASKALYTILSLSPINDFETYLPKILQGFQSNTGDNNSNLQHSSSSTTEATSALLTTETAKQSILSCLPWDRLCPLLAECKKIVSESKNKSHRAISTSLFSLIIEPRPLDDSRGNSNNYRNDDNPDQQLREKEVDLWNLLASDSTSLRDETLNHLELSIALHTMNQRDSSNNNNILSRHQYFSSEPSKWALDAVTPSSSATHYHHHQQNQYQTPKSSHNNNKNNILITTTDSSDDRMWNEEVSPWADEIVNPNHHCHQEGNVHTDAAEHQNGKQLAFDEEAPGHTNNDDDKQQSQQQEQIDFFKAEVPTRSIDNKSSPCWTSLWKAMHRALIGHGDTLGIVGPSEFFSSKNRSNQQQQEDRRVLLDDQQQTNNDSDNDATYVPQLTLRVKVWPPSLSFAPALLKRFIKCGTLHNRLCHLVSSFLSGREFFTATTTNEDISNRRNNTDKDDDDNNLLFIKTSTKEAFGSIGMSIMFSVQQHLRSFENEVLTISDDRCSSRKISHSGIMKQATFLQKEFVPRVLLLAELFSVTDEHDWCVDDETFRQMGKNGMDLLNRLYRWLVNHEHVNGTQYDGDDDGEEEIEDHNRYKNSSSSSSSLDATQQQLYGMIKTIFIAGLRQFHKTLMIWIRRGVLKDPYNEFFLATPTATNDSDNNNGSSNNTTNIIPSVRDFDEGDDTNDDNSSSSLLLFIPEFFSEIDLDLVRNAGIAQLLLETERKFGAVNVMWDILHENDSHLWPRRFLVPAATENWYFFAEHALAESVVILSMHSPLREFQNTMRKRRRELHHLKEQSARRDLQSETRDRYAKIAEENNNNSLSASRKRPPATRQRDDSLVAVDDDDGDDDKKNQKSSFKTKSQIWNEYMEEAKAAAVKELLKEHEIRMAESQKRSERTNWRSRRVHFSQQRLEALKNEKDSIVESLVEYVQSGRSQIAVACQPQVTVPIYFSSEHEEEGPHHFSSSNLLLQQDSATAGVALPEGSNNNKNPINKSSLSLVAPLPTAAESKAKIEAKERQAEEDDEVLLCDDEDDEKDDNNENTTTSNIDEQKKDEDDDSISHQQESLPPPSSKARSVIAPSVVTTTTSAAEFAATFSQVGQNNAAFNNFLDQQDQEEEEEENGGKKRNFEIDFNYNASNERIGLRENGESETREEATERMLKETEEFMNRQLMKQHQQQQNSGQKEDGENNNNNIIWNTKIVSSWAEDLISPSKNFTKQSNNRMKPSPNQDDEDDYEKDDETDLLSCEDDQHDEDDETNNNNNVNQISDKESLKSFRISSLSHRYRSLLIPLCQRLIHRSLRISLQESKGMLRSVTDALNSSCLLQHPKAAVDLQDRLLDIIFISPTSSKLSSSSTSSSTAQFMVQTKPTSRLSSCHLIWRNFWNHELQGEHNRFLNVSLDFSSTLYAKINQMAQQQQNSSANSDSHQQQTLSPLMILQFARLSPHFDLTTSSSSNNNSSSSTYNKQQNDNNNMIQQQQQFFENLLPSRCIDRYGRVLFALLTWTIMDRMCVQLWRVATSRDNSSSQQQQQRKRRQYYAEDEDASDDDENEHNRSNNSNKISAALWEFVTVSRGVLTSLRENIWHGVSMSFRKFNERLMSNTTTNADNDDNDFNNNTNFDDFRDSVDDLLNETHQACCLTESQREMRKTISVLMRIVEQVYSAIILVGQQDSVMSALSRVPPNVLQQQTEQFVLATKTLETQVVSSSSVDDTTTSSSNVFTILAGIRSALPKNTSASS